MEDLELVEQREFDAQQFIEGTLIPILHERANVIGYKKTQILTAIVLMKYLAGRGREPFELSINLNRVEFNDECSLLERGFTDAIERFSPVQEERSAIAATLLRNAVTSLAGCFSSDLLAVTQGRRQGFLREIGMK